MSVQNEILRIQTAKNNLKTSIRNKDVTVPDATKIDGYPPLVDSISGGGGNLQQKSVTPSETAQQVTPDSGYDGLSEVDVAAIPSDYVGSGITRRSSTDLTASSATVTVPAGYYDEQASKAVQSGTMGTPRAVKGTVSNNSINITPKVTNTAGYIIGGAKTGEDISVSASELVSGNKEITENGTDIDVTNYATVSVDVASGGGGAESVRKKDVNFYDCDGTILYSYTAAEFQALTALPENPSHSGLVAQGWNWSLANAKTQVQTSGTCDIGQMYVTDDGKTRIYVEMQEGRLSPVLQLAPNGTVQVDWGDNSSISTLTGTSLTSLKTVGHTYEEAGSYVITLTVMSGEFSLYGGSATTILRKGTTIGENRVYAKSVQSIRLGSGVASIGSYALSYCASLKSITMPSSITSVGSNAFQYCYSLEFVTIPTGVTSIGTYAFQTCSSLTGVALPSSVTNLGNYAFSYCASLPSITIPSNVTSVGNYGFANCSSLASVTFPSNMVTFGNYMFQNCTSLISVDFPTNITSIGTYTFQNCYSLASITLPPELTTIGNNTLYNCYSLSSITIPSTVTSIGSSAFYACMGVAEYHFRSTTPPTLSASGVFSSIPSDCVIYVPAESLTNYQTATNWSNYASYIQGE